MEVVSDFDTLTSSSRPPAARIAGDDVESHPWYSGIGGNALTTADVQALARGKAA
jgi:hypothetical protein